MYINLSDFLDLFLGSREVHSFLSSLINPILMVGDSPSPPVIYLVSMAKNMVPKHVDFSAMGVAYFCFDSLFSDRRWSFCNHRFQKFWPLEIAFDDDRGGHHIWIECLSQDKDKKWSARNSIKPILTHNIQIHVGFDKISTKNIDSYVWKGFDKKPPFILWNSPIHMQLF